LIIVTAFEGEDDTNVENAATDDDLSKPLDMPIELINENEKDFIFVRIVYSPFNKVIFNQTKENIIKYIDSIEAESEGWINKYDHPLTKIWAKLGGSHWDKVNPIVKCEFVFNETNNPKTIYEAYMKSKKRVLWDDGVEENLEIIRPSKYIQVHQVINKAPLNFKSREFIDKRIFFKHNGVYYIYMTFVPDSV
jgi:hypothetical protein